MTRQVEVFYSLQSAYCYFLLDRLIALPARGVDVIIRPVLGGVIRQPERYKDRGDIELAYFQADTARTAAFFDLPFANPDPSPIVFESGPGWRAAPDQPRNEHLNRLFVGASNAGRGLDFLDHVARMLWNASTPGWDTGDHLAHAMSIAGLDMAEVLAATPWEVAKPVLDTNAQAMLDAGHWGVPLMVYQGEPFYGQDRFDQLLWRMKEGAG
ncbi:DsbA family protein [Roseovarius sp. 2305UL8-3]|uniref:DsbA family protein n=1 Tax=Roseovarius conchicola TaxID=3121636 RepID=UPI003528B88F